MGTRASSLHLRNLMSKGGLLSRPYKSLKIKNEANNQYLAYNEVWEVLPPCMALSY